VVSGISRQGGIVSIASRSHTFISAMLKRGFQMETVKEEEE